MKICFLVSGGGGNLKFFYLLREKNLIKDVNLYAIAYKNCGAVEFCKNYSIPCSVIQYSRENNIFLLKKLEEVSPDFIITTWNKILDYEVVNKYRGKLVNLHYSLLPAFKGLIGTAPIKEAYSLGCQYIGITTHYVNEEVDSGKIISQAILKTNIPKEEAIVYCFRYGCLILLNTIVLLSGNAHILNPAFISKEKKEQFQFSPSLVFDEKLLNENFWMEISEL